MDTVNDIKALAVRFFAAIERGSVDEVLEIYAPNAVIWHNTDEQATTPAQNAEVLAAFVKRQTGRDALQWLTAREASNVIEELKKWLAR